MNAVLNTINTLATWTDYDDEVKLVDINGTLYKEINGEREPLRFNVHDGGGDGPDGDILNHANLRHCGWEVGDSQNRHFRSSVIMPSYCFTSDIEQADGLSDEAIDAIKDWAEADLEVADQAFSNYAKPLEKETIEMDFSDWLDEQDEDDERDDEEKIQDFIDEESSDAPFFWYGQTRNLIEFHDEDEIREICRNYLKK